MALLTSTAEAKPCVEEATINGLWICGEPKEAPCNATGDDFDLVPCPFGCGQGGCQSCSAGSLACSEGSLFRCDDDGSVVMEETCIAGCVTDGAGLRVSDDQGIAGDDGTRAATFGATGGPAQDGEGVGGNGGFATSTPTKGGAPTNANAFPGGGGGSAGFIQVFTPAGIEPTLTPMAISPPFQPNGMLPTR